MNAEARHEASSDAIPVGMATTHSLPISSENSLPPELMRYILALSEPISMYTRYMDALLIKRTDHGAFFRDLKAFRCQPHIVSLLTTVAFPDFSTKEMYLTVTRSFLASRFAHPWCRTSQLKEGWSKAGQGSTKKQSEAGQREEQRMHKLLVGIWCGFRVRMMPSEEAMEKFLANESRKAEEREHSLADLRDGARLHATEREKKAQTTEQPASALGRPVAQVQPMSPAPMNAEAYCMELSDEEEARVKSRDDDAEAAAKLFVGVAATGFLASNKQARKYLMKKLNKRS